MSELTNWHDDAWEDSSSRQGFHPSLLLFPILGFLIFEWTAKPMLGVFIACLKPAMEDGRTAFWLVRRDPRKSRGWACCWMFLAAGFWKTFASSFVLGILLVCLSANLGGGNVVEASLQGSWLAALFGFVILIVSSALAVGSALLSRTQVWASRDVHRARRVDAWPPSPFVRPEAMNQVDVLMMPMLLVLCLGLVAAVILLAITAASTFATDSEAIIAISVILSMIVGSGLILWLRDAITLRMVAGSACSCWPPEGEASYEYDPFGMPR